MTNVAPIVPGEANFTHTTQDIDHGASSSQRITMTASPRERHRGGGRQHHLSLRQNNFSMQSGSESSPSYVHGYPTYLAPDPSTVVHDVQWVYEWESLKFYSMLISEWQTTSAWMRQIWDDYKASLIANHRIALMSINDYHMTHYTWMMHQWVLCIWRLCSRVVQLICAILRFCVIYNVQCL
jgi:hypothetical protein